MIDLKRSASYVPEDKDASKRKRPRKKRSAAARAGAKRKAVKHEEKQDAEYAWRQAVFRRDGYKCRYPKCRFKYAGLHAHHIHPRSQRPDLILDVENGIAICNSHHLFIHFVPEGRAIGRQLGFLKYESYEKEHSLRNNK